MLRRRSWTLALAVSVGTVAVVTGAIYGLREVVPVVSTGVVYLLAVMLVSIACGLWLGLLTAAAFNFFHIPPTTSSRSPTASTGSRSGSSSSRVAS